MIIKKAVEIDEDYVVIGEVRYSWEFFNMIAVASGETYRICNVGDVVEFSLVNDWDERFE